MNLVDVIKTPVHGISYLFVLSKKDINRNNDEDKYGLLTKEKVKTTKTKIINIMMINDNNSNIMDFYIP